MENAISEAPTVSGIYRFWSKDDQVLYVGKAKILKARIRSHILETNPQRRHKLMMSRSKFVDWIITPNEVEALILEDSLIKKYRPDFNIRFRDDKRYPLIRLDLRAPFPTLSVVRRAKKDGAKYFGPFTSARLMKSMMQVIERYYPLRRCQGQMRSNKDRGCLHYQMNRCPGICFGNIDKDRYREIVNQVKMLLEGRTDELIHFLTSKMQDYSLHLNFEVAARIRDQIQAIRKITGG